MSEEACLQNGKTETLWKRSTVGRVTAVHLYDGLQSDSILPAVRLSGDEQTSGTEMGARQVLGSQ